MSFENWLIAYILIGFVGGILVGYILGGARQLGGDDRINKRIFKG